MAHVHTVTEDRTWQDQANCLGVDPDLFFPERGASTREAKEVCRGCVVRAECLEYALANGEICMAVGFSGDIMQAGARATEAGNGVKIQYEIPREGAPIWFDMVAMPVDANNEEGAYAFMNDLLQPEVMAAISNHVKYANGNAKADALVDPALKADPTVYPPESVMDKLYTLEAMPLKIDRVRTRIWSKVKSGV